MAKKPAPRDEPGRYSYDGLDRVLHEKARLGILSALAARPDGAAFTELVRLCALTDGNLSRQLQLLQEAGMIEIWKGTRNNRPQTLCRLSAQGRGRIMDYIAQLERVVSDALAGGGRAAPKRLPPGRGLAPG